MNANSLKGVLVIYFWSIYSLENERWFAYWSVCVSGGSFLFLLLQNCNEAWAIFKLLTAVLFLYAAKVSSVEAGRMYSRSSNGEINQHYGYVDGPVDKISLRTIPPDIPLSSLEHPSTTLSGVPNYATFNRTVKANGIGLKVSRAEFIFFGRYVT